MKTLTEFSGFALKDAISKKNAWIAEGKPDEEVQAGINEFLKLDETKVPFFKNTIDMTLSRLDAVKRVVVAVKANEQEKVPEAFIEREGHFYLVEYFSQAPARNMDRGNDRFAGKGRGSDRGNDRGRGRPDRSHDRGGERPAREPRAEREPRPEAPRNPNAGTFAQKRDTPVASLTPKPAGATRPARAPRPDRPARKPRDANAPRGPKGAGELRLVLKGESSTTLMGSGTAAPAAAEAASPSEST